MNVQPGSSINFTLGSACTRLRYVLIVPQISGNANYTGANMTTLSPMNSPFSSAPSTTCPYASLIGFNLLVSGASVYQENINYSWQNYLYETRQSGSINGGYSDSLSSGLISYNEWNAGYRFIYVDLSRRSSEASDNIRRSIQVIGTNGSKMAQDYYIITGFEKEINISTQTGSLIANA
jgi:hypothetical protein